MIQEVTVIELIAPEVSLCGINLLETDDTLNKAHHFDVNYPATYSINIPRTVDSFTDIHILDEDGENAVNNIYSGKHTFSVYKGSTSFTSTTIEVLPMLSSVKIYSFSKTIRVTVKDTILNFTTPTDFYNELKTIGSYSFTVGMSADVINWGSSGGTSDWCIFDFNNSGHNYKICTVTRLNAQATSGCTATVWAQTSNDYRSVEQTLPNHYGYNAPSAATKTVYVGPGSVVFRSGEVGPSYAKTINYNSENTSFQILNVSDWLYVSGSDESSGFYRNGYFTIYPRSGFTGDERVGSFDVVEYSTGEICHRVIVTQTNLNYNISVTPNSLSYIPVNQSSSGYRQPISITSNTNYTMIYTGGCYVRDNPYGSGIGNLETGTTGTYDLYVAPPETYDSHFPPINFPIKFYHNNEEYDSVNLYRNGN